MFSYVQNRHGQPVILGLASELAAKVGDIVHVNDPTSNVNRLEILHSIGKAFTRGTDRLCYGYPDRSVEARDRIVEAEARFAKLAAAKANVVARTVAVVSTDADIVRVGNAIETKGRLEAKAAPKAKVAAPKLARIDATLPAAPAVSDAWLDFRDMLLGKVG